MSERSDHSEPDSEVSRRTFMKASGVAAGAGLFGAGAVGSAAASADPLDDRLLNWRVAEAKKVWDRGYRGRPDRSLGLTDSGVGVRHPDLGPWNGARIRPGEDGDVDLEAVERVERLQPVTEPETYDELDFSGANVGAGAVGLNDQTEPFDVEGRDGEDVVGQQLAVTLSWNVDTPEGQLASVEATLQRLVDEEADEYTDVASVGPDGLSVAETNEVEATVEVEPGETYRFDVTTWRAVAAWTLDVALQELHDTGEEELQLVTETDDFDGPVLPDGDAVTTETPKTVGWYSETTRYGGFDLPRDQNGHGSHVAGIMAATGRASVVDSDRTAVHEPGTVLFPGDFLEYEVTARAGTGVFASALGEGVVVEIVHDDQVIHEAPLRGDSTIADAPTVHESGEATYTVRVKPAETEAAVPVAERAQAGTPLAGRLERVAVGAYCRPSETVGERVEGDRTVVHPGVAPNASIVGFLGLGEPTNDLGGIADAVESTFNLRAVNMSWGPLLGLPLSGFGALPDSADAVRQLADAGVLTVAAAGNAWTPANGNGEPGVVGETISVVATDPFDGITGYSSGGIGGLNEEMDGFVGKPDVTAPGGDVKPDAFVSVVSGMPGQLLPVDTPGVGTPTPDVAELVRATAAPDPEADYGDHPPRDHASKGGTSMASPYVCGVVGLVAQAMEEDAPDPICLPEPGETSFEDVMRLKQVVLATASTTAFTAAPYHSLQVVPSAPVYAHGERDPYEGYGRVNPDAAVDAVTRDLLEGADVELGGETVAASHEGAVGLDVPFDSRAVAGYVTVPGGDLDVSVEFDRYAGGNAGLARGDPHVDLFVYDAEEPAEVGEPNIVESAVGAQGSPEVTVSVDRGDDDDPAERTFFVVAKLVNVPGAVNGTDLQVHFDLDVEFSPAGSFPAPEFAASGERSLDSTVVTGGESTRVDVTVSDLDGDAVVLDLIPDSWRYLDRFSDGELVERDGERLVRFGRVDADEVADGEVTFTYFLEAPSGLENSNRYALGPARAVPVADDEFRNDAAEFADAADTVVVGLDGGL